MDMTRDEPQYVGGVIDMTLVSDDHCSFFEIAGIAKEDLKYKSVEKIWYLTPGESMATGLHEILSDVDVVYGLLVDAAKGEIHIFLEATKSVDGVGDNENGADGDDEAGDDDENDTNGENSVAGEFVNMNSDNDDHGTIIGSILKKRKECNVFDDFDEEVDHTNIIRPDRVDKNVNADGEYAHLDHNLEVDPHSPISIYRKSSDSEHIAPNLSDEDSIHPVDQQPFHNGKGDYENIQLVSGMKFQSAHKFNEVIVNHSISIGADIIWKKSCKTKLEAICREKCGWRVYASWHGKKEAFMLKTVGKPHSCPQKLRNKQATSKWIANTFLERFRLNPNWDVKQMIVELNVNHALEVSYKKCFRAKWIAKSMLEGTLEDEYKKIRPYIAELKKVDPEGRFLVEVDINGNEDKVFFQRFFVGFSSLIKGFLAGCRPVLGLDGCFLKGEIKGMLLCGWKRW
ncbi:hypothetical protein LINPERPRIM_LOCUS40674 [Linum perenne]